MPSEQDLAKIGEELGAVRPGVARLCRQSNRTGFFATFLAQVLPNLVTRPQIKPGMC